MGINEVESLPHQSLFVVEDHAMEVDKRLRVDKDTNFFEVIHTIAFSRLRVKTDVVGKAGATAALDAEAKSPLFRRDPFLGHGDANPLQGTLSYLNALLIRRAVLGIEDG